MTDSPEILFLDSMDSPLGKAILASDSSGALRFHAWDDPDGSWRPRLRRYYSKAEWVPRPDIFGHIEGLRRYFEGDLAALGSIEVAFSGTPFQASVWRGLRTIPAGRTLSYAALAHRIGTPKAVRATGRANGSNPIGVVVPCHRVVGSNGSLTGFGGGLPRKRWLLDHEARHSVSSLERTA